MSSQRKIDSARANGAKSRGPKTPEGKRRSSQNAIRHGLFAQCTVLDSEDPEAFRALCDAYLANIDPLDDMETSIIEDIASAYWRSRRAWAIETTMMNEGIRSQAPGNHLSRMTAAFSSLAAGPQLPLIFRYETRLHRMFQRSLHNLLLLRRQKKLQYAFLQNEPNPISGHSTPDPPEPDPLNTSPLPGSVVL